MSSAVSKTEQVYFIPGIMGTSLVTPAPVNTPIWDLNFYTLANALIFNPDSLTSDLVLGPVIKTRPHKLFPFKKSQMYGSLLDFLKETCRNARVVPFPYDWRASNTVSARLLADSLINSFSPTVTNIIVSHSMGGIVALLAAKLLNDDPDHQSVYRSIRKIINIGTPHLGSALAYRSVADGMLYLAPVFDKYGDILRKLNADSIRKLRKTILSFPSVFEILPPEHVEILRMRGRYVNTFEKAVWRADAYESAVAAQKVHRLIGDAPTENLYTIYGFKHRTEGGYDITETYERDEPIMEDGDQTVVMKSAQAKIILDRRLYLSSRVSHLELPGHSELRNKLKALMSDLN